RKQDVERGLANAYLYMECFGHVVVGWMWLRQAQAALRGLQGNGVQPKAFYEGKLTACEYFMRYELPKPLALAEVLEQGDRITLEMPDELFWRMGAGLWRAGARPSQALRRRRLSRERRAPAR